MLCAIKQQTTSESEPLKMPSFTKLSMKLLSAALFMALSHAALSAIIYDSSAISSNLRNISGTGTQFNLNDDQNTPMIGLGFNFDFFGSAYSSARISSNGFLTFSNTTDDGCCTGGVLGDSNLSNGPGNMIAGLWEDLDTSGNSTGTMYYDLLGSIVRPARLH